MWIIDHTNDYGILATIINLIRQTNILYSSYSDISCVFDVFLKKVYEFIYRSIMI